MIHYISTRGLTKKYSFSEALLQGIAPDGGLLVPEVIPHFTLRQLELLLKKSYQQRAEFIFSLFKTGFSEGQISRIIKSAYSQNFDDSRIVPIYHLKDNQYISELWHGPTSAFKDLALQIMPLFFSEVIKKENQKRIKRNKKPLHYLILAATSGDTGKAAMEGYKNKKDISIITLYPDGLVSKLQELQMVTQEGNNVEAYAVSGNFDAVQACVKKIFSDNNFSQQLLKQYNTLLSSANSINWGRLIGQIVYHVNNYLELVNQNAIALGKPIDIAVPTGNFGNILAGFYAKKMGLPVQKFICASNANHVLTDFIRTGVYDIRLRDLIQTPSPSMDILIASNMERLLFLLTNNTEKVRGWMEDLKTKMSFSIDESTKKSLQREFVSDWVSNTDCLANIKEVFKKNKYLMDPHTSVAQLAAQRCINKSPEKYPVVVCATAYWAKFARDVYKAIYKDVDNEIPDEFTALKKIEKIIPDTSIPQKFMELQDKPKYHNRKCPADYRMLKNKIIEFLASKNSAEK